MRIENLKKTNGDNQARISATIAWEDVQRPAQEIYYEVKEPFADDLTLNPNAFLLACAIPAMHAGEKRVMIEEAVCPELLQGLEISMKWLRYWYKEAYQSRDPVQIEVGKQKNAQWQIKKGRAGFFYSGGVDSIATLRYNRLHYPREHPASIKDGFLIGGLEIEDRQTFQAVVDLLADLADEAELTFIPVFTNIRDLNDDWHFWGFEYQGAALSSVAHAFAKRTSMAYIASSDEIASLLPLGSHPVIDPNYSSTDLRIKHDGITLTRYEKTKMIAQWEMALKNLRVCTHSDRYESRMFNCGRCEKCVRTMLALLTLGALEKSNAFPSTDVLPEHIAKFTRIDNDLRAYYLELQKPLEAVGRHDLVRAIFDNMENYQRKMKKKAFHEKYVLPVQAFDRRFFNGAFRSMKRRLFNSQMGNKTA